MRYQSKISNRDLDNNNISNRYQILIDPCVFLSGTFAFTDSMSLFHLADHEARLCPDALYGGWKRRPVTISASDQEA